MWNSILFLSVVAAIGVIAATLCAPALPFIADHFSAHVSSVQFTISLFLVGNAFGQFFSGPLSDRLGRRSVLLCGLLLFCLSSCGCALSNQMGTLLLSRFFQGMGSASGPVLARAIAVSHFSFEKSARVQAYGAMGVGIASALALLGSGVLTAFSWRGNFWMTAVLGGALFLWARGALKREVFSPSPFSLREVFLQMRAILKEPKFTSLALCHSLTYGLMYGYIALFPFLLIDFFGKKDPTQIALYSIVMIGAYTMGTLLSARAAARFSHRGLVYFGVGLQMLAGGVLLFSFGKEVFLSALLLFNVSIGLILPLTSALALAPFATTCVGTASSTLGLSYRLIGSCLSTLICQLPLASGRSLGGVMLLLAAASGIILKLSRKETRERSPMSENVAKNQQKRFSL